MISGVNILCGLEASLVLSGEYLVVVSSLARDDHSCGPTCSLDRITTMESAALWDGQLGALGNVAWAPPVGLRSMGTAGDSAIFAISLFIC